MTFSNNAVASDVLPAYENITLTMLPREAMIVNMIVVTGVILVLMLIATIGGYLLNIPIFVSYLGYWLGCCLLILSMSLVWIRLSHIHKGFAVREHDILFKTGVIWRKLTVLPFNRIQHVETQQGVMQRKYELATIQLFTAGGQRADLTINGMAFAVTEGIKQRILNKIQLENFADD